MLQDGDREGAGHLGVLRGAGVDLVAAAQALRIVRGLREERDVHARVGTCADG